LKLKYDGPLSSCALNFCLGQYTGVKYGGAAMTNEGLKQSVVKVGFRV
jgi:hypothetical protein